MREAWPDMVRMQWSVPTIHVTGYAGAIYDEDSPHDRFQLALGHCIQGAGQILRDPVRPTSMSGGAKVESSQIKRGRRRRAT